MKPAMQITAESPSAKVKPASAPVSSTSASLMPSTIELMYWSRSSSTIAMSACSCSSSCLNISSATGAASAIFAYSAWAFCSPVSIMFMTKVRPNMTPHIL